LNYRFKGIYLYPNLIEFRQNHTAEYNDAVVSPDDERAGQIEGQAWKNINIFVETEKYNEFCQDAEKVYKLYCNEALCFRGIPDVWFDKLGLVDFIRAQLRPHPAMTLWFQGRVSATPLWLRPPLAD
jgi:hypothetical protein